MILILIFQVFNLIKITSYLVNFIIKMKEESIFYSARLLSNKNNALQKHDL